MPAIFWIVGLTILAVFPLMTKVMVEGAINESAKLARYGLTREGSRFRNICKEFVAIVVFDMLTTAILAAAWYGLFSLLHNQMHASVPFAIIAVPAAVFILLGFARLMIYGEM